MMNILASLRSAIFEVIMSEINPADRKSIRVQARLIPDERFRGAVRGLVESERDNKRVEVTSRSRLVQ